MPTPGRSHDDSDVPLPDFGVGRRIKSTRSVCPSCLASLDATVLERDGAVWMDKTCPVHGRFSALLASDARHYYRADPRLEGLGACCGPGGCGPPRHRGDFIVNHSCNMLFEITQRCNLTCPTCYADSSPKRDEFMPLSRFGELLDGLIARGKGDADLIQLSGGEPTLHPELFEMIDLALGRGVRRVYINTNGIRLSRREFAERLASFGPRVSVYLQLDGFERRTLRVLRGDEELGTVKARALSLCEELAIDTVPVVTLARGVNDGELGDLIHMALEHPRAVSRMMIQPAMYSGRFVPPRLVNRVTVADVARRIASCSDGLFGEEDFGPIPCSDPNCFSMALAVRTSAGPVAVSRYFPRYDTWGDDGVRDMIASVSDSFDNAGQLGNAVSWAAGSGALATLDETAIDALLDTLVHWQQTGASWGGMFAIGIKPFMDAFTYDQDRIDKCCVHVISTDGTPVSFCEYNALRRPRGQR